MKKEDVIKEFKDAGALLEGHFILSSGLHSSKYLQCALALSEPLRAQRLSTSLGKKILDTIKIKIDLVVSPAMGGLIIGHEIARYLNVPSIFLERVNGKFELRRGFSIKPNSNCLLVEDIVTTGLSSNASSDQHQARNHPGSRSPPVRRRLHVPPLPGPRPRGTRCAASGLKVAGAHVNNTFNQK